MLKIRFRANKIVNVLNSVAVWINLFRKESSDHDCNYINFVFMKPIFGDIKLIKIILNEPIKFPKFNNCNIFLRKTTHKK